MENSFGWIEDRIEVRNTIAMFPLQSFQTTDAWKEGEPKDTFLWNAARKVLGKDIDARNQNPVGSCVGFGFTSGAEYANVVEIVSGESEEFQNLCPEITYAGSRVEVGGGRVNGDGSVGAWAAEFIRKWGFLPRGKYGKYDLTKYDPNLCRELGRTGVPDELEEIAKRHPARQVVPIRSFWEAAVCISNGYPVAACSSVGFESPRDKDGFCAPRGIWYHCMVFIGVLMSNSRKGLACLQSWGAHEPQGPIGIGEHPSNVFWVEATVADAMLRQNDSYGIGDIDGFPARKLDWNF